MSQFFYYPSERIDLAGKLLVVPVVSTANVAQLAVDLLISSMSLRRIGIFDPEHLMPFVAARENGEVGVTTPLELYGKDDCDVLVIQQRSPAFKSRKVEFVECLLTFIRQSKLGAVLFLSGIDVTNRTDAQMLALTYHVVPANAPPVGATPLGKLLDLPIPVYTSPVSQRPRPASAESTGIPFIPGGGLTCRILSTLDSAWSTPTAALLQFVLEGDNRGDAHHLAAVVAKVLGINSQIKEWKEPESWRLGLFGAPPPPDDTMYG